MKLAVLALTGALVCLAAGAPEIDKGKVLGSELAPVRIQIFSDYECPQCRVFHEQTLPLLMRDFVTSGKVCVVSREFPLNIHQYSRQAAYYATAAARIGRYDQVQSVLFHTQEDWGKTGKVWETVASVLTPEQQKKVQALAKEPATIGEVQADSDYALRTGLNSTPTLLVSRGSKSYTVPGSMNYTLIKSMLNDLLK